ncbi:hypothetical protein HQ865_01345 [Mucilaginibacter mali]|uniref:Uncharacterized protein n=1 Tax=Mucilaginibacter mali TaxID=2740462 RepID=A0A7D4UMU6_9SPHI|nr:hypothetical protein [Mucilaginibacter mali]QKJ28460.1 hypothetical protein HQ865_01345 [Mucilaginibacter mali]
MKKEKFKTEVTENKIIEKGTGVEYHEVTLRFNAADPKSKFKASSMMTFLIQTDPNYITRMATEDNEPDLSPAAFGLAKG